MVTHLVIVGAGVAGVSAAAAAVAAGATVTLLDQGRFPGGRLGLRRLPDGRPVDTGAAYLTARSEPFGAHVAHWRRAGIITEWTDTVDVVDTRGWHPGRPGPMRWAAPGGLRGLVEHDVAALTELPGVVAEQTRVVAVLPDQAGVTVVANPWPAAGSDAATPTADSAVGGNGDAPQQVSYRGDGVILAMPGPQARRLGPAPGPDYEPVISVWAGYAHREWRAFAAAFINDHPILSFLADDGSRRGDAAAVLVAHTTSQFAAAHLGDPDAALGPVLAAIAEVTGWGGEPSVSGVMRWGMARPIATEAAPFGWCGDRVAVCGDAWHVAAGERARVESAWLSGWAAGAALAQVSRP